MRTESHKRTEDIVVRLNRRLRTFCQCYSTFFQDQTEQELLQSTCEILAAGGELRLAWVGYCDNDAERTIRPVAKAGFGLDYLEHVKISWQDSETRQGPVGIAIRTGKPCWVNEIRTDPRFRHWRAAAIARGYASCIALPLIIPGKPAETTDLCGTLNLYSARRNAFDDTTIENYADLARCLTYAVAALRGSLAKELSHDVAALRSNEQRRRTQDALLSARSELARVTRLTTMGQLAASIAHEINQPLAAIVANGNAGWRFLSNESPDLDEVREILKAIISDAHRASEVIEGIRATFRKGDEERGLLDLNELIRETLALMRSELQSHRVSAHTELADRLPRVPGGKVQLQQVILNLIVNAVEALSSASDHARMLRVRTEFSKSDDVLLTIEDSGPGIDADNLDRIFDPFFTTKSHGMGMGLSICRSIIEAHNGRLWATRAHPSGSVFHIVLPADRPRGV